MRGDMGPVGKGGVLSRAFGDATEDWRGEDGQLRRTRRRVMCFVYSSASIGSTVQRHKAIRTLQRHPFNLQDDIPVGGVEPGRAKQARNKHVERRGGDLGSDDWCCSEVGTGGGRIGDGHALGGQSSEEERERRMLTPKE